LPEHSGEASEGEGRAQHGSRNTGQLRGRQRWWRRGPGRTGRRSRRAVAQEKRRKRWRLGPGASVGLRRVGIEGRSRRAFLGVDQGRSLGNGMPNWGSVGVHNEIREGAPGDGATGVDATGVDTAEAHNGQTCSGQPCSGQSQRAALRHRRFVQQGVPDALAHWPSWSKGWAMVVRSNAAKFVPTAQTPHARWWIDQTVDRADIQRPRSPWGEKGRLSLRRDRDSNPR
jgi:hypothetical protein